MNLFGRGTIATGEQRHNLVPIKTTVQVLTEIREEQKVTDLSHLDKLEALKSRQPRGFSDEEKNALGAMGFHIFIRSQWVGKFLYHANIYNGFEARGVLVADPGVMVQAEGWGIWVLGTRVDYKGDIPNSVIEKAMSIKSMVRQITIHSMQPLPVEFVKCDPILIGWACCPQIQVDGSGKFDKVWYSNAEGVVISIWDYDKEVEAL